jgi:O-antigen ligase
MVSIFGAMNAFVECQIYIVVISLFLLLKKDIIENKKLLTLNILGSILFLVLALERSPILMGSIILFVWKMPLLFKNFARTLRTLFIVAIVIILAAITINNIARNNPMLTSAYQRLMNAITLNFEEDGSIKDRENRLWSEGSDLARENSLGIGPGRVTPSAHAFPGYFGPHNNYLLFYLAYGIIGFVTFISFLIAAIIRLLKQPLNIRLFGFGLILSYCLMAWFNIPFSSKNGILFFILLGFLVRSSDIKTIKIKDNDYGLAN